MSFLKHRLSATENLLLRNIRVFLFDCDGVIWKGQQPIPGAVETLNLMKNYGKQIYYVTNNSTKSRAEVLKKLISMGINSNLDEVITSAYATAQYLASRKILQDVYVVGEEGIYEELNDIGIHCFGKEDDNEKDLNSLSNMNTSIGSVVVGLDRNVNYIKLSRAAAYIRDQQCRFIATNTDGSFPYSNSIISGGSGCMVSAVSTICGKEPDVIIGKPSSFFIDLILDSNQGLKREELMMVGDRLDTDICFARRNNILSLCVLTGISSEEAILAVEGDCVPHFFTSSIADLIPLLSDSFVNVQTEEKQ